MTDTRDSSGPDAMMGAASLPADIVLDAPEPEAQSRSLTGDAWRELRGKPSFWFSVTLIAFFVIMAIVPQLFSHVSPRDTFDVRLRPNAAHWFGTDGQGYDIYSRTIHGARASILVGVFATLLTTVIGGAIGVLSAYLGGWLDALVSRITDVFFAIPLLLGGILFMSAFPSDQGTPYLVVVFKAKQGVVG